MAPRKQTNTVTSDTAPASNPEHDKLIEVLRFTPRTYKLRVYGYGGEYVMGKIDRKIYDYFKSRRLSFEEFCYDDSYAEENNIPEEMRPFDPGCWHECDELIHISGADIDAGTLEIEDETGETIYSNELSYVTDDGIQIDGHEEAYIHSNVNSDTVVFHGISSEKGMFFETQIELTAPFDKEKLTIFFDDVDGTEIMCGVQYDGEDLDCYDMNTTGKGYDMYMYALRKNANEPDGTNRNLNDIEHYKNVDSIDWPMTEWYPKKIKPAREGIYEILRAGKDGYRHQAKWNGTAWTDTWNGDTEYKIKEWRGVSADPDTLFTLENTNG